MAELGAARARAALFEQAAPPSTGRSFSTPSSKASTSVSFMAPVGNAVKKPSFSTAARTINAAARTVSAPVTSGASVAKEYNDDQSSSGEEIPEFDGGRRINEAERLLLVKKKQQRQEERRKRRQQRKREMDEQAKREAEQKAAKTVEQAPSTPSLRDRMASFGGLSNLSRPVAAAGGFSAQPTPVKQASGFSIQPTPKVAAPAPAASQTSFGNRSQSMKVKPSFSTTAAGAAPAFSTTPAAKGSSFSTTPTSSLPTKPTFSAPPTKASAMPPPTKPTAPSVPTTPAASKPFRTAYGTPITRSAATPSKPLSAAAQMAQAKFASNSNKCLECGKAVYAMEKVGTEWRLIERLGAPSFAEPHSSFVDSWRQMGCCSTKPASAAISATAGSSWALTQPWMARSTANRENPAFGPPSWA